MRDQVILNHRTSSVHSQFRKLYIEEDHGHPIEKKIVFLIKCEVEGLGWGRTFKYLSFSKN